MWAQDARHHFRDAADPRQLDFAHLDFSVEVHAKPGTYGGLFAEIEAGRGGGRKGIRGEELLEGG